MIDSVFKSTCIPGQSVRYRIIGSGRKILFLHGTWVDPFIFEELLLGLSKKYAILIPDIPPFGKSRSRFVLSLPQYAHLFDELLRDIHWQNVTAIGHSFGGGIALYMAASSTHVSRVIGCNPIGIAFQQSDIVKKYPTMVYSAISRLAKEKDTVILKKLLLDVGCVLVRNPLRPIIQTITQCLCNDEQILSNIPIPVHIIWAKQDELLPPSYIKQLSERIKHAQITYINGHHNWCLVNQSLALRILCTLLG